MPNLVEITIKGDDETGAAFASVLAKYAALKSAMQGMGGISIIPDATSGLVTSNLIALKSKMQSAGVTDFLGIDSNAGKITSQILFLKRSMQSAGLLAPLGLGAPAGQGLGGILPIVGANSSFPAAAAAAAGAAAGGRGGGGGGGGGSFLGGLFGGLGGVGAASGGGIFGALAGALPGVLAIHTALDLVIEALISIPLAAAAAAIGIAAMAPTLGNINDQMQSVFHVSTALGIAIPPLSGQFKDLAKAMAPQTIELFGAGLSIVNKNTGALSGTAHSVVNIFDTWAARINIWSGQQGGLNNLLHSGTDYLLQFGRILGTAGMAVGNLVRDDPGIAHYLLDIIQGTFGAVSALTRFAPAVVEAALALHGLYLWGSVLGRIMIALGTGILGTVRALFTLAALPISPLLLIGTVLAGIALAAYELDHNGTPAINDFVNNINSGLSTLNASQLFTSLPIAIGQLQTKLKGVTLTFENSQFSNLDLWKQVQTAAGAIGTDLVKGANSWTSLGRALNILVGGPGAQKDIASVMQSADINKLNNELNSLVGGQKNLFKETGNLIGQGYNFVQTVGLMDLAGVKQGDTFQVMKQKVDDLITGYKAMSVQGGILSNSVNATSFAVKLGDSGIQNLTQGYTSFFQTLSGGESGMVTFAQNLQTMNSTQASGGGSFGGFSSASLTNIQNWLTAVSSAQTEANNLFTMAAAAGMGKKGTDLLTQSVKDMVDELLPAAQQSQTLTTILYGLAQQGGYQGADSFKALTTWVGNLSNPMDNLQGNVTLLTGKMGNLNTDVQNLSTAMGVTLNNAMATAIATAAGGTKPFDNFASAVLNAHGNQKLMQSSATALKNELLKLEPAGDAAKNTFFTFATEGLGLTQKQADELWQNSLPQLQKTIDGLHGKNINVGVNVSGLESLSQAAQSIAAFQKAYNGKATGGIIGAAGGGTRTGWTMVGEHGAELAQLPTGSTVHSNSDTMQMLAAALSGGGGGGGGGWQAQVGVAPGTGNLFERLLQQAIRVIVLKTGGGGPDSVQKAFGQGVTK